MAIKIFIDQGHNPGNPNAGAEGNGLREQDITYEVGRILGELLTENGNFEVKLSRNSPTEILGTSNAASLAARTNAANEWGADYFISVHADASDYPSATGTQAFVFSDASASRQLALDMTAGISRETGIVDRGVSARPSLWVLRKSRMPATLVEIGFITNPAEAALMEDSPELFARGMYEGIVEFFGLSE